MAGSENELLRIIQYTDPYCTWCWGSEPIMKKIEEVYGDQIEMEFIMGGLVRDVSDFYDPLNKIGGAGMFQQVADHWREASQRHGMPVDADVWLDMKDEFRSTWPANIACKAAQFQGIKPGNAFIRRMREAAAAERKFIHRPEVQEELAGEAGLDRGRFVEDLDSGAAEEAFHADLEICRSHAVEGFPTFIVRNREGIELGLHGYHPYSAFDRVFTELAGESITENPVSADEESILAFISRHPKVAPREISEVYSLSTEETDDWIGRLEGRGLVSRQRAGNGWFISFAGR